MENLQQELISLVLTVLTTCVGIVTTYIVKYLKDKGVIAKLESKKELVNYAVLAIEQAYVHLNGEDKLNLAKLEITKLLKEKNIKISEHELNILIEGTVKHIKVSAQKELSK
jgi:uncharacterized membrane protein YedE/YeeE